MQTPGGQANSAKINLDIGEIIDNLHKDAIARKIYERI